MAADTERVALAAASEDCEAVDEASARGLQLEEPPLWCAELRSGAVLRLVVSVHNTVACCHAWLWRCCRCCCCFPLRSHACMAVTAGLAIACVWLYSHEPPQLPPVVLQALCEWTLRHVPPDARPTSMWCNTSSSIRTDVSRSGSTLV